MEDFNATQKRIEDWKKYQDNPQAFFEKFMKPEKHVGQWIQVEAEKRQKEKGFVVKTKFGTGRTKHSDTPIQGKLPVYLTDGRKVLMNPKNIKITGFIN
jgi:hypothetical protein